MPAKMAYWRRLAEGVTVDVDGQREHLAIGTFWRGSMWAPSVIDCMDHAPTQEHQRQAALAVDIMKRCSGVVLLCRSDMPARAEEAREHLEADFARLGRRLFDVPVILQATFQDLETGFDRRHTPEELGALIGVAERLCVASVANKCIGVREAVSLLLKEIRSRTASTP